jgi:hypothetical protein
MAQPKRVLVVAMLRSGEQSHSYYVSQAQADIMIARGDARPADDGTRRILAIHTRPRGTVREWRKTASYDPDTRVSIPTMQLVEPRPSTPRRILAASSSQRTRTR